MKPHHQLTIINTKTKLLLKTFLQTAELLRSTKQKIQKINQFMEVLKDFQKT